MLLLNDQIYQLAGGYEEIYKSQSQLNPMMPHSIQSSFMHGQSFQHQYFYEQFGQMKPYSQQNPFQQRMGMQTQFQINPMMSQGMQYQHYHGQFNQMMPQGMNPHFYQGMMNPFYHNQFNPMNKAQKNIQIPHNYVGKLVWKESTKFSTNILINYSKNKASSIHLDNNFYLKNKVFTIKVNENK